MPHEAPALGRREIRRLLRDHARTFALTLGFLPEALRRPLSVAYLLARASDTVADAGNLPPEQRLSSLEQLDVFLGGGSLNKWHPPMEGFTPSEGELLEVTPSLITILEGMAEKKILLPLWRTILQGQILDLRRVGDELLNFQELDYYCGLVAGSVGCAWTKLIALHFPDVLLSPESEMAALGNDYGKGLQLLNILRDRAGDRALGRIYVRDGEVPALYEQTRYWLNRGGEYCVRLRPGRIRYASELPLRLGIKTLERIRSTPQACRVKIGREEVALTLLEALPSLWLPNSPNPAS